MNAEPIIRRILFNCSNVVNELNDLLRENLRLVMSDHEAYVRLCISIETHLAYTIWIVSLFEPLLFYVLILFVLPLTVYVFLYACSFALFFKKHWSKIKADYSEDIWHGYLRSISIFWETQGSIWHGYEIIGLENIPEHGPGLLVYYHGALPIDFYYVYAKTHLYRNRRFKIIADKFLFRIPGLSSILEAFEATPGDLESCTEVLKNGSLLAISPGGVREALFGDHTYQLLWGKRCGFAKAAVTAKAPVIPMFTQNCREAFRSLSLFRSVFRWIYEKTRLPIVPIYGMFPVKLRTYIGKPIEYDENRTAEQLAELTKKAIEELIEKHQRRPGNIFLALVERFFKTKTD